MSIEPYASLADQNAESVPTYTDLMVCVSKVPIDENFEDGMILAQILVYMPSVQTILQIISFGVLTPFVLLPHISDCCG